MKRRIMQIGTAWMILGVCACFGMACLVDYYVLTPAVVPGPAGVRPLDCVDPQRSFTFQYSNTGRRIVVNAGSPAHEKVLEILKQDWRPFRSLGRRGQWSARWKGIQFLSIQQDGREKMRSYAFIFLVPCDGGFQCYHSYTLHQQLAEFLALMPGDSDRFPDCADVPFHGGSAQSAHSADD